MDLARPTFSHLPRDEFCERTVRRDHCVAPLWSITWTSPARGKPAPALVPPNDKGHVFPIEVCRLEKHRGKVDAVYPQEARAALRARRNVELRAAAKEDPSSLSADDLARAKQLLARDARKAAQKKAAHDGDSR